jgi:hypothetical protein
MVGANQQTCSQCGTANATEARVCGYCGATLNRTMQAVDASGSAAERESSIDPESPEMTFVDPNDRVEVRRFERANEAELACGMLRANGIPAELSAMMIPGLSADTSLWVHARDADVARQLLAEADKEPPESDLAS